MKRYIVLLLIAFVFADVYLQNPSGSNNRGCEVGDRRNANRLFNSQNNARGGYACQKDRLNREHPLYYYVGSHLLIEWTAQHGCGSNPRTHCNVILQYMCGHNVRNGYGSLGTVNALTYNNINYGMHEDYEYHKKCIGRSRNLGLFTADRFAREARMYKYTQTCKQVAEGRHPKPQDDGECEEQCMNNHQSEAACAKHCAQLRKNRENQRLQRIRNEENQCLRSRKNIADRYIRLRRQNYRNAQFTRQTNNGAQYGFECNEEREYYPYWHPSPWKDIAVFVDNEDECKMLKESQNMKNKGECIGARFNNKHDCEHGVPEFPREKGKWHESGAHHLHEPECVVAKFSRSNHLGSVGGTTEMYRYWWKIPDDESKHCVFRVRYNMSTTDYDPKIDHNYNRDKSPIQNNPKVLFGNIPLQLNYQTQQSGRTFEDRSHVFEIRKRGPIDDNINIWNLNIRGKKGALVPNFPALEYDFVPNELEVSQNDLVHIQWSGSEYNPAGNDRNNLVEIKDMGKNYPYYDVLKGHHEKSMFTDKRDILNFATVRNQPYYDGGLIKMRKKGTFYYMSTVNNAYTNRDQKGTITVK